MQDLETLFFTKLFVSLFWDLKIEYNLTLFFFYTDSEKVSKTANCVYIQAFEFVILISIYHTKGCIVSFY